ncbi:NAD(P)/FAD-dependent oxidoreductase [Halopenitus persicus]|uniref:NAD(P)/FAD-dependent oxidoreductase n=1 Tax=Halopenitus persicus TaxID=1048396 RepID=UPI000BBA896D|nr:FAD-dependent oxidoreductase [Halopenitus persicus]
MRVIVVGGGIVGFACAYYLADRGADVTVLEKSSIGAGATDRAAGGIRAQFSTPVSIRLSLASIDVWESFEETFGVDIGYRRPGYLYLARTDATADLFRETIPVQNDHGVPSEFLASEDARRHVPGLRTETYAGAAYCPTDGFADPHLGLQGFSRAAAEAGATVETGVEVTDVLRSGEAVRGVDTTAGRYEADVVVNAAGSWSPRIARMAGVRLPVSPRRRQAMVVNPETPVPEDTPFVTDLDDGVYFRPERDGAALVGGHFASEDPERDPDAYRTSHDLGWAAETLEHAATVSDRFGPESEIVRGWAGLYAMTPDHHPIIEESRPGFVTVTGFSGHGFMQSPAAGQVVSELVLDGAASTVDVSELTADRFERGAALHETYVSA